jgi:hypothetical protein
MGMDLLRFAYMSLAIQLVTSALMILAAAGPLALEQATGTSLYTSVMSTIETRSTANAQAAAVDWDDAVRESQDSGIFDIIGGMLNLAGFVFKFILLVTSILINYSTMAIWLSGEGTGGAIAGVMIFIWQFWTAYYLYKFVFTTTRVGNN